VNKIITFVLGTILGGLLQLWVVFLIVVFVDGKQITAAKLLGDGGLLFFSTSLAIGSGLALFHRGHVRPGTVDANVAFAAMFLIFVPAIVAYVRVMPPQLSSTAPAVLPFSGHVVQQLTCTFGAIVFAFFVGVRTGQFEK